MGIVEERAREVQYDSFAEDILKDLVAKGFSGEELVFAFKRQYEAIRRAIARLNREAEEVALGIRKGATMEDVFGEV